MFAAILLGIGLLFCQGQCQLCGPSLLSALLYENGPGPQLGPLAGPLGPVPSCGQALPPCGIPAPYGVAAPAPCGIPPPCGRQVPIQVPPSGISVPPCGIQVPSGISVPSCGIQVPSGISVPPCGIQVPSGISVPPCGIQVPSGLSVPSSGIQVPSCGLQAPPCGISVPPCGISVPPCGIPPIINNIAPTLIPNQPCGQCSSMIPNQCGQCSLLPALTSVPNTCDYGQNQVITVVDNTLANTLANALQLLIVSNLLESSLSPCASLPYSPVCETNPFCGNIFEILAPDYPCNQAFETVYEVVNPCIEIPCEPIVTYTPIVSPGVTGVTSCNSIFGQEFDNYALVNPYSNCGCSDIYGSINLPNFGCSDNFGLVNTYANGFGCSDCGLVNPYSNNFYPDIGLVNPYSNNFVYSDSGLVNSYPNNFVCSENGLVNPFANGFGCLDSIFSPVEAEVFFPAEIPAQLTCNFGYMPNNVPCVSVNVEPLPFDCSC